MSANLGLEIIVIAEGAKPELDETVASLTAQTSREFGVLLVGNHGDGKDDSQAIERQFQRANIPVRRLASPERLERIELWNWACAQSKAAWLAIIISGERFAPEYVECLQKRIQDTPEVGMIRCDIALETEWGQQRVATPFNESALRNSEIMKYFPARIEWLAGSLGFAWQRTAWLTMGGFANQLPGCATLNLNLMLALHYGLENMAEVLAMGSPTGNGNGRNTLKRRINFTMELWLILRQAQNYCLAAKLPSVRWPWAAALRAAWLRP